MTVLKDMSHNTVCVWEITTEAARIAAMKGWFADMEAALAEVLTTMATSNLHDDACLYPVRCFAWSMDATNSSVWKGAKLHALVVDASYLLNFDRIGEPKVTLWSCSWVF